MRIVLSARGSRGDVRPMVSLAAQLQTRGHSVTMCLPSSLEALGRDEGLETRLYEEDSFDVMHSFEDGWRAAKQALQWFSGRLDHQMQVLTEACRKAEALVSTVNELMAPSAAEYHGLPYFRLAYSPVLAGNQPPPLVPIQGMPGPVNLAMWRMLNKSIDILFRGKVNDARRTFGLPDIRDIATHLAGSSHTLHAVSQALVPSDPAWKFDHSFVGYCFGGDQGPLPGAVEDFLSKGPAPIYLGFGSVALRDPETFADMALHGAKRAGCRIILSKGWTGLGSHLNHVPDWALVVDDLPHANLFPRVAAAAHHGGSGTVHNAARAGIAQFVMPQIADQYYWGDRIRRLGLGPAPVSPNKLDAQQLSRIFGRLLSPGFSIAARRLATRLRAEDGTKAAADHIEQVISTGDVLAKRSSQPFRWRSRANLLSSSSLSSSKFK